MVNLIDELCDGMYLDLVQMDSIIGQFFDYVKLFDVNSLESIDLVGVLEDVVVKFVCLLDVKFIIEIMFVIEVVGNGIELVCVFSNLIENVCCYGKMFGIDCVEIYLCSCIEGYQVVVEVFDYGLGVFESECECLLCFFIWFDIVCGQVNGFGLGLVIVNCIVFKYNGKLLLKGYEDIYGGLLIQIFLFLKGYCCYV